jgi:hypothetical protein
MHALLAWAVCGFAGAEAPPKAELVEARKIWDRAPHSAFTDLVRFKGRWLCVFREGKGHVSPDGAVRVLSSADGREWASAALLTSKSGDLRDPKITLTLDGKLMLTAALAYTRPGRPTHQTFAWFSANGRDWGEPVEVGDPDYWLWRVTWHGKVAYGIGYDCSGKRQDVRLYRSGDGKKFETVVPSLFGKGYPNESALLFGRDGGCLCLLRRDGKPNTALLGSSKPPYREWAWKNLDRRVGGPNMVRLPDGRLVAVVRLYDKRVRTAVCELDAGSGKLTELLALPSGGDTSYAGLVWHDGLLWISYYASHEGKTSIYLAKVRFGAAPKGGA